ncbi:MAG TPA: PAS domain-containing protein, partial [Pyrinomonadaceae bacterium]|nr:PAS domain-containing protein [Pyrinomonadaceae bacterium]
MPTSKPRILSRHKIKQTGALNGTEHPDAATPLRSGLIEAGTAIEFVPSPAALWSLDRHSCFFNDDARELLGFCEHDFKQDAALWLERIHPDDRKEFLRAWKSLQAGETRVSSRYRFQPKNRSQVLWLREASFLYASHGAEKPAVWTFYLEELA